MRLTFRQGLVKFQKSLTNVPDFLTFTPSGNISLKANLSPTLITFAHGRVDYLFEEARTVENAWQGPFLSTEVWWLYWDIDLKTGVRTFGRTKVQPYVGKNQPPTPQNDEHWFDTHTATMKVWSGTSWVEKVRVFAAEIRGGAQIIYNSTGSQVGITSVVVFAGYILFDEDNKPVKKFNKFNLGEFLTTESPLASQTKRIQNFKLEAAFDTAEAVEQISQWKAVAFRGPNKIGLARSTEPYFPAIGIAAEPMLVGELKTYIVSGYISDPQWNYTDAPGALVFVGETGSLTTSPPQEHSVQRVGVVVDPTTLYINVQPLIRYEV